MPDPEIKYVEMPLKIGFFERQASLRDYDFNMETGERTVNEKSKIGKPIKKGEPIRIIFPLVESKDKKWIQAMGNDGTCGYIRANRIDMEKLQKEDTKVKPLPKYRRVLKEGAMIDGITIDEIVQEAAKTTESDARDKFRQIYASQVEAVQERKECGQTLRIARQTVDDAKGRGDKEEIAKAEAAAQAAQARWETASDNIYNIREEIKKPIYIMQFKSLQKAGAAYSSKERILELPISKGTAKSLDWKFFYDDESLELNETNQSILNQSLSEKFDIEEATYGNRFYAEESCKSRLEFSRKAITKLELSASDINSDTTQNRDMMIVGETDHSSINTRKWLTDEINKRGEGILRDVNVIYVEDIEEGIMQNAVNEYLSTKDDDNMPEILSAFCEFEHKGFYELLKAAKDNNIHIIGFGSDMAQAKKPDGKEKTLDRAARLNQRAIEIIETNPPASGKKGLIYAGVAHTISQPSSTAGKVIKGFSQIYNQNVLFINEEGKRDTLKKDSVMTRDLNIKGRDRYLTLTEFIKQERESVYKRTLDSCELWGQKASDSASKHPKAKQKRAMTLPSKTQESSKINAPKCK